MPLLGSPLSGPRTDVPTEPPLPRSILPGIDGTLLDIVLQKPGMSYQTTSGKKHLSINLRV
jgi:hypothetical protein